MNLSQAPEQGIMYALYRNKVVYQPYIRENLICLLYTSDAADE